MRMKEQIKSIISAIAIYIIMLGWFSIPFILAYLTNNFTLVMIVAIITAFGFFPIFTKLMNIAIKF